MRQILGSLRCLSPLPGARRAAFRAARTLGAFLLGAQLCACAVGEATPFDAATDANTGGSAPAGNSGSASIVLNVPRAYLIQVQQRDDGSIPLVAGRDAYLRVFLTADRANSATPEVRARLYKGDAPIFSATAAAPGGSVPQEVGSSGDWNSSYNFVVPGRVLTPGVSLRVDTDPNARLDGAARGTWPADGSAKALSIATVETYRAVAVPIASLNPGGGLLVGNVSAANLATYYKMAVAVLPISNYSLTLRPGGPFTINRTIGVNGSGWGEALNDLQTAQYADSNGPASYWFGFLRLSYTGSGVCGIHVTPGRTGLLEDDNFLDMDWAQQTLAHEEGHGFGLLHAPCNGPASVDPSWPKDAGHANAKLGNWGMNVAQALNVTPTNPAAQLFSPQKTDLMSYCDAQWLSDYTYNKALAHQTLSQRSTAAATMVRQAAAAPATGETAATGEAAAGDDIAAVLAPAPTPHLVLSGQVRAGRIVLEHAVRALGVDRFPEPGPYRISGFDPNDELLFSVPFAPLPLDARVAPGAPATGHALRATASEGAFLIAVPLAEERLVSRYVFGHPEQDDEDQSRSAEDEQQVVLDRQDPTAVDLGLRAQASSAGAGLPALVTLSWNASLYKKAFVQDATQMVGVVEGGQGYVLSDADSLRLVFTDGMDSLEQTVTVEK